MAHLALRTGCKRVPTSTKVRLQVAALEAERQDKLKEVEELQTQKAALVDRLKQLQQALHQQPSPSGNSGPPCSTQGPGPDQSKCLPSSSCSHFKTIGLPALIQHQLVGVLHALWQHTEQERQWARHGRFCATAEQAAARSAILAQLRGCWCTALQAVAAVLHQQQQQQQQQQEQEEGPASPAPHHQQLLALLLQTLQLILESLAQASTSCLWHFVATGCGATDLCTTLVAPPEAAMTLGGQQATVAAAAAEAAQCKQLGPEPSPWAPPRSSSQACQQAAGAAGASGCAGSLHNGYMSAPSGKHCQQPHLGVAVTTVGAVPSGGTGCAAIDGIGGLPLPDLDQLLALEGFSMEEVGGMVCAPADPCPSHALGQQGCAQERVQVLDLPVVEYHPVQPPPTAATAATPMMWRVDQMRSLPPTPPASTTASALASAPALASASARDLGQTQPLIQPGPPPDLLSQLAAALLTGCPAATQETLPPACTVAAGGVPGHLSVPAVQCAVSGCLEAPLAAASPPTAGVLRSGSSLDDLAGVGICGAPGPLGISSSSLDNVPLPLNPPQRPCLPMGLLTSTVFSMVHSRVVSPIGPGRARSILASSGGAFYSSSTPSGRDGSMLGRTDSSLALGLASGRSTNSVAHVPELPQPIFSAMSTGQGALQQSGPWPVGAAYVCAQPAGLSAGRSVQTDPVIAQFTCIGPAAAAAAGDVSAVSVAAAASAAAGQAALSAPALWQCSGVETEVVAAPPLATAAGSRHPARRPAQDSSRWQVLLDRLQLQPHQVTKLLQLYDALGDAQRIHHLRLSELTHRLLDLSCASIQRLLQGEVATTGTSLGHGLLGTPDAALLEAADELQQLLMEGHQLLVELLLGVWGPQSPLTPDQCCRGLVAALPSLPDTGALLELLAQQQRGSL